MIDTREKLKKCLEKEKLIYFPTGGIRLPFGIREKDILYSYIYYLRKTEYYYNTGHKFIYSIYKILLQRLGNRYSMHIGINVCDEGLSISHVGPIIINGRTRIGKNLRINVGVNIGANGGNLPVFGNDVYIGPGAKVFGDIYIANGCRIGANAVVNKSCNIEKSTLLGVPACAYNNGENEDN